MNKKQQKRYNNLLPEGKPRYIRCYDNNGKSFDQYTVVFTGRYTNKTNNEFLYVGMSKNPYHPQGFGQHGYSDCPIDRPTYSHLGKKIKFDDLPGNCQKLVLSDYIDLWELGE
jgi:hypothetical protein